MKLFHNSHAARRQVAVRLLDVGPSPDCTYVGIVSAHHPRVRRREVARHDQDWHCGRGESRAAQGHGGDADYSEQEAILSAHPVQLTAGVTRHTTQRGLQA